MPIKSDKRGKHPNSLNNLKPAQKGDVRNPNGRPKGAKNRSTVLKEFLDLQMKTKHGKPVSNPFDPNQKEITVEQAIIASLLKEGLSGNVRAIQEILDTIYGKNTEKVNVSQGVKVIRDDLPDGD